VPGRAPVPESEVKVLKALALGACALFLLATPAAAHVAAPTSGGLTAQLRQHIRTLRHDRQVIRFFESHRWLLSDPRFQREATRQLESHRRHRAVARRRIAATRAAIAKQQRTRRLAAARPTTPEAVICRIFGEHCKEAVAVARCESRLQPWARNGQYLGLFQMGTSERLLFGHGGSAADQARAAFRYFVASGRDWSPWGCKPWW
jgi:hypothetical protein